ncbi:hypothetical protein [Deinococcus petrolearius]|uniref:DUF4333 domain-containing protein n=1 Tax=Deinococcus petrolearius TaxID=1751295 RepID=A0ABW1DGN2_9DEIO
MTGLTPQLPPREVTPQERARSVRTFWIILLGFVTLVGAAIAYAAWGGRQMRDYGQAVYAAATRTPPAAGVSYDVPCAQVLPGRAAPKGVRSCVVGVRGGEVAVVLATEGGREYRMPR